MKHGNRHFCARDQGSSPQPRRHRRGSPSPKPFAMPKRPAGDEKVLHSDGIRICACCGFEGRLITARRSTGAADIKGAAMAPAKPSLLQPRLRGAISSRLCDRDRIWSAAHAHSTLSSPQRSEEVLEAMARTDPHCRYAAIFRDDDAWADELAPSEAVRRDAPPILTPLLSIHRIRQALRRPRRRAAGDPRACLRARRS